MNSNRLISPVGGQYAKLAGVGSALLIVASLAGCSGGNPGTSLSPTPTPTAKTTVQVSMGDAPADWMVAFSMNISSMSLTGGNGSVNVISTSTPIEMMHLMGIMQPLAMVSVPQGTYTGASVAV